MHRVQIGAAKIQPTTIESDRLCLYRMEWMCRRRACQKWNYVLHEKRMHGQRTPALFDAKEERVRFCGGLLNVQSKSCAGC